MNEYIALVIILQRKVL